MTDTVTEKNTVESKSEFQLPVKRVKGDTVEERLTENAYERILPARYLLKDEDGNVVETPEEMFERVARNVAQPDKKYDDFDFEESWKQFYQLMTNLKFMPNSPTLMNAGAELQQLSACFVVHPEDDMDSIFGAVHDAANIFQTGGGVGYPFHLLRPKGDPVSSTGGIASGPLTFQQVFDTMCFVPGTRVLTPSGYRRIESIETGDRVIDENGDPQQVTEKMDRKVNEEIVELTPERLNQEIEMTKEHPVKVLRNGEFEWVVADEIDEEDQLMLQTGQEEVELDEELDLAEIVTGPFIVRDTEIEIDPEFFGRKKGVASKFSRKIPKEKLARLAGWYLAEGSISYQRGIPGSLVFTLHIEEEEYRDEIMDLLSEFKVNVVTETEPSRSTLHVKAHNSALAGFFKHIFGAGYDVKEVPDFFWKASKKTQMELVEALFQGDGYLNKRGNSQRACIKLANQQIIDFVYHVGLRHGVQFGRYKEENQSKSDAYSAKLSISTAAGTDLERLFEDYPEDMRISDRTVQKTVQDQEHQLVGVQEISNKRYKGEVHNLEVENTHTYIAEGVTVHNCGTIKQGGKRRGAQMGIMRVDHPDVLRFIVSKRKEGNLSNFNISVGLTHDFMEAVKNDEEYELINPTTGEVHEVTQKTAEFYNSDEEWYPEAAGSDQGKDDNFWRDFANTFGDEVEQFDIDLEPGERMTLPARFIWECLVDGAWRNGEPGFYVYDEANDKHSFDVEKHPEHKMEATNPCVIEGTLVNTPKGYEKVEDIDEGEEICTTFGTEPVKEVQRFEDRKVYRVEFSDGGVQTVTGDHRFHVKQGEHKKIEEIPLRELEEGDWVRVHPGSMKQEGSSEDYEKGFQKGVLLGDGCYTENTMESQSVKISLNERNEELVSNIKEAFGESKFQGEEDGAGKTVNLRMKNGEGQKTVRELGLKPAKSPEKDFDILEVETEKEAMGILDGLLISDGNINLHSNHPHARWNTTSPELAEKIRKLLLSVGCHGRIPGYRKSDVSEIDGRKIARNHELIEVNISGNSLKKFIEKSNAEKYDPEIDETFQELKREWFLTGNTWKAEIESIQEAGTATVYDLYCEDSDTWITEGYVQQGCAEQPLENYEACNLGHINLSLLVEDKGDGIGLNFYRWAEDQGYSYETREELDKVMQEFVQEAIDVEELERIAKIGTRFLDNVVTMSDFPLEEIEETVSEMRKVGLGLMGFAQMLIQLGIRYGSEESIAIAKEIQRLITRYSVEESHRLAEVRGEFGEWEKSKWAEPMEHPEWFKKYSGGYDPENFEDGLKLRNHNTVTIAPTGTTSMIGNTSGGCEPIYQVAYFKNVAKDIQGEDMLVEFDDYFLKVLEANNVDVDRVREEVEEKMRNNEWEGVESLSNEVLPPRLKQLFMTSDRVKPEEHVDIQAAFQQHNHSGISKTCNFPNDASKEDVREVYMRAYDKGIKGMTVYRDGTRDVQVMQTNKENTLTDMDTVDAIAEIAGNYGSREELLKSEEFKEALDLENAEIVVKEEGQELDQEITQDNVEVDDSGNGDHTSMGKKPEVRERPKTITGTTQEIETAYGDLFVTINDDENGPFEVFTQVGKSGGYTQSFTEALGRTISLALRTGADAEDVIKQLDDIRSPQIAWDKGTQIHSVPDAIAEAMKRHLQGGETPQQTVDNFDSSPTENIGKTDTEQEADAAAIVQDGTTPECPECGGMLILQEGCKKCPGCGWSRC